MPGVRTRQSLRGQAGLDMTRGAFLRERCSGIQGPSRESKPWAEIVLVPFSSLLCFFKVKDSGEYREGAT